MMLIHHACLQNMLVEHEKVYFKTDSIRNISTVGWENFHKLTKSTRKHFRKQVDTKETHNLFKS